MVSSADPFQRRHLYCKRLCPARAKGSGYVRLSYSSYSHDHVALDVIICITALDVCTYVAS